MLPKVIGICALTAHDEMRAVQLAQQWGFPYVETPEAYDVVLMVGAEQAFLRRTTKPTLDWSIDFTLEEYRQKRAKRTRHKDALSRAIGLHKHPASRVLDMSAGLGKDAYWLAYCGAHVTLLERHPVLAYLLQQAIERLQADPTESDVGHRMQCVHTDAEVFLQHLTAGQFDVAYYDPMFLPRRKSALVKKDMQIMHDLLGEDRVSTLWPWVQQKIPRFVVKRAKADPPYDESTHWTLETGTTRYEVYQTII